MCVLYKISRFTLTRPLNNYNVVWTTQTQCRIIKVDKYQYVNGKWNYILIKPYWSVNKLAHKF